MKKSIIATFISFASFMVLNASVQVTPTFPSTKNNPGLAEIVFGKETHEFGIIPYKIPASYNFVFKNTGNDPLIISKVFASNGTVTADWSKEPILPGKKGYVKVTYNAASVGPFNRHVTVESNAKKSQVVLTVTGEVKAN